jgi:XrtN system VIT domain protein
VLLVLLCINYLSQQFFNVFPQWLQHVSFFLMGIALVVFVYLSAYLSPMFGMGVIAAIFLGFSLHVFVPLLFFVYSLKYIGRQTRINKSLRWSVLGGVISALMIVVFFVAQWSSTVKMVNQTYRAATVAENDGLPSWVYVAQKLPQSAIAEKALKTGLVYVVPDLFDGFDFWNVPTRNFGNVKLHDPLIVIGTLFGGRVNLDEDTKIKVLEAKFDARHQAQRRFWQGTDLITEQVNTSIDIWPQFGMSYTEKQITISNMAQKTGSQWSDQQEAIYTFHLPEGAVITSLSLWIEGLEMKGILTTKEKAAEAYNTIVGQVRRDPSVVHWQEGNTVSVRVFPVMAGESRKFKLGITAPIKRSWESAGIYENIYFDGPDYDKAKERVTLNYKDNPADYIIPASFEVNGKHSFVLNRSYEPHWNLKVTDKPLSGNAFSFDGRIFTIQPYEKKYGMVTIQNIYLDINKAWTWDEFNSICKKAENKNLFVYNGNIVKLNESNKEELFYQLQEQEFSLFPVFYITDRDHSLLITKNSDRSPNIGDLTDSRFLDKLKTYLKDSSSKILLYDLGEELSPYLKTLKEYRVFRYEKGRLPEMPIGPNEVQFAEYIENDDQVVIENAGMVIQQANGATPSIAPDHLMRLFSYNHIMQKMGTRLLTDTTVDEALIEEAAKAYVVSPVSSLVVLESQADYDRFHIKDTDNSLKNASHSSKGAVPEPHEWALIIIAVLTLGYAKFYRNKKRIA